MKKKFKKYILGIPLMSIALLVSKFYKKDLWLICEKTDEARDNGYHFFVYCMKNLPSDIKKNVYYVIDKNAVDYGKISMYKKNVIFTNSLKHCIFYFKTKKMISSQALPFPFSEKLCRFIFKVHNQKFYWLQHGVTINYIKSELMDYSHKRYSLICCVSPKEVDFFKKVYGYTYQPKCIGFSRFDNLKDKSGTNNYILIMPTYRKWLSTIDVKSKPTIKEESNFLKSDFYKMYYNFIYDKKFNNYLKENNLKVIFYLHYGLQNFAYLFKSDVNNTNIIIADRANYDVQKLLVDSKIMITDYSSVFFDFAYMRKPVIYFQFDKERFREEHYNAGYFSYENDGFGPVFYNVIDLVNYLIKEHNGKYNITSKYLNRLEQFYPLIDHKNCYRILNSILNDDDEGKI